MIWKINGRRVSREVFSRGARGLRGGCPGISIPWPAGKTKYISGAARFANDPAANCGTRKEAIEKIKAQGNFPEKC